MISNLRRFFTGMLFISPWLVGFLLLTAYPFCASLYWSFCRYDLLSEPEWIGAEHYARLGRETAAGFGSRDALAP